MEITLIPWNGNERLYFYRQSHQLAGQTGQIGKLRADFGSDGTAFFSTWEDIRSHLKTDEFRHDFDSVINTLRFDAEGTPLGSRKSLKAFLHEREDAKLPGDENWYGFRVNTEQYSHFFRLNPSEGDYNVYVWSYRRDWLDEHMTLAKNGIRFIDSGYNEKFRMPDGGRIRIEFADGTSEEMVCRYIDDTHVEFNGVEGPYNLQHICQFAEQLEKIGAKVVPVTEPMTLFKQRYYCPLQLVVFELDEYGDAQDDGYVFDGKYAAHFEDDIKELLGREHSYEGCDPKSMASYQDNPKVLSTEWDVENVRGTLYGVIRVGLAAKLSASEEEKLKAWITGQNSDGFGEGLEQRPFETDDSEFYVSFWNSDSGYFVKNESEFRQYLNKQNMGGIQL